MNWLLENIATIVVCIILGIAVLATIRFLHRNRKEGKCAGCSCGCSGCPSEKKCK